MRAASLVILIAGTAGAAHAQPLLSAAFGDDLAGGTLTIEWGFTGGGVAGITSAPIVAFGATGGMSTVPAPLGGGSALFTVDGDTFASDWSLTNGSGQFIICAATFNLNDTLSLFDDDLGGVLGGTPFGLDGVDDVTFLPIPSTAPMQVAAFEFDAWADPSNVGDMYWQETILWNRSIGAGPVFLPGLTYVWHDDTDVVPAPGPFALLGLAAAVAARRRARGRT